MMHKMMKRTLALILAAVMVFGMAPAGVLAVQSGIATSPETNG